MKRGKVVAYTRRNQNLFVLVLIKLKKAIAMGCKKPKYIIS